MTALVAAIVAAVVGLGVGPWFGVVVDRAVEREPLRPVHRCRHCGHDLATRSLVPVVGWSVGCATCGRSSARRYAVVDLGSAAAFAAVGWRFADHWLVVPYLALAGVLVVLSVIDIETHLLPNVIVWPAIGVAVFVVLVLSGELAGGDGIGPALVGGAVFGGVIGAAHVVNERGMGRGDVKLALLLGLFVGWPHGSILDGARFALYALLVSLLGGAVIGLVVNRVRRTGGAEIPFGPFLATGALATIVASPWRGDRRPARGGPTAGTTPAPWD